MDWYELDGNKEAWLRYLAAETQLLGFLRERTYGHLERSGRRLFRQPPD